MKCPAKRLIYTLAPIFLLTNCNGGGKLSSNRTSSVFQVNQVIEEAVNLNEEQRNIATRICYAYESKSNNFHNSDYLNSKYNFTSSHLSCLSNTYSRYNLTASLQDLNDNTFKFTLSSNPSGKTFYEKVQTDNSGYLRLLCGKIKLNLPISNTTISGDKKVQIYFFKDSLDSYILKYFEKIGQTYTATSAETFKVRTQFDYSNGQILGMDEVYLEQGTCARSPNNISGPLQKFDYSQSFISRIK